jgi:hypothetical protein
VSPITNSSAYSGTPATRSAPLREAACRAAVLMASPDTALVDDDVGNVDAITDNSIRRSSGMGALRSTMTRWISIAQRVASTALANITRIIVISNRVYGCERGVSIKVTTSESGQTLPRLPALAPPDVRYASISDQSFAASRLVATGQTGTCYSNATCSAS